MKMPETMTLPFKNRALGLKDQKLWKIGVFLGGGGGLVLVNIL